MCLVPWDEQKRKRSIRGGAIAGKKGEAFPSLLFDNSIRQAVKRLREHLVINWSTSEGQKS